MARIIVLFLFLFVVLAESNPSSVVYAGQQQGYAEAGSGNLWNQFGANPQRTHYVPNAVSPPWRLKWIWNGSDNNGNIPAGKFALPRNSQPVVGGGRVYIAAGMRGVYALDGSTGRVVWNRSFPGDSILSTPAYDGATNSLYVVSRNGILYRLHAGNGTIRGQYLTGQRVDLPLPPALAGEWVYFSMGRYVHAVNKRTMSRGWRYDAGSVVETPPAYSASRNRVVVVTRSLHVHAINAITGQRVWRRKPTPLTPGNPTNGTEYATASNGWPVIAEQHGLVFVRYRLHWESLWDWPSDVDTNEEMRTLLQNNRQIQPLFALDLDTGQERFIPNVGNGGYGDGNYLPMGPLPVIKRFPNATEVAYVVMRGNCQPQIDPGSCDSRWDSHLGEMVLDDATVPGYQAGYVRYIRNSFFPTDEQPFLTMAGDHLLAAHWEAGLAHRIVNRSAAYGDSRHNPIPTANLPHVVVSQDVDVCGTGFRRARFCGVGLYNTRPWPGGFYNYWQQGAVYDQFWSEYASWVVAANTVYFVSTDGAILAFESSSSSLDQPPHLTAFGDPLAFVRNALRTLVPPPAVVSYRDAAQYAGQEVTVQGKVKMVFSNGKAVYLAFENPHQGTLKVRIMKPAWSNFQMLPLDLYQEGMVVQVRGRITWYQGDPVIYAEFPSQIAVISRPAMTSGE